MKTSHIGEILRESLPIGGWVSMWRPPEVFLYDWWAIRNEIRLSDRLAAMPGVKVPKRPNDRNGLEFTSIKESVT
jgi:hypothetical protein